MYIPEDVINKECPRCLTFKPFKDYLPGAACTDEYFNICEECRKAADALEDYYKWHEIDEFMKNLK